MMSNHPSSNSRDKAITPPPPAAAVNCPRCDSSNTKFCYYNNYSLSQPRHFCKTCKRYWTKGGVLRNVPIGGGCRKNKKTNKSSSSDSNDTSSASSYSDLGRFNLFNGLDFQHGGGLNQSAVSNFGLNPNSETNMSQFMAFNNFPLPYFSPSLMLKQDHGENNIGSFNVGLVQEMGPVNGNLASSMESFTSTNQDLHWTLPTEWHFGNSSYAPAANQIPRNNENGKETQGWAKFD